MTYKEKTYFLTQEAHDGLVDLLATPTASTASRRRNSAILYDGQAVLLTDRPEHPDGISHHLNILATVYDTEDFLDGRTDFNKRETPPTKFTSIKQYRDYLTLHESQPSYKQLWSNKQIYDYLDYDDPETGEPAMGITRKRWYYKLSPGARSFYYHLAVVHKMQPPTISLKTKFSNQYVAAALEAIGCRWLLLPEDYKDVLEVFPNKAKARIITSHKRRLYGNHNHEAFTPDLEKYQPFTRERMLKLREEMIANGELTDV